MPKLKITLVQFVDKVGKIDADEHEPLDVDEFKDSYTDSVLDAQDHVCETSDGKFEFVPGTIDVIKVEEVSE